MSTFGVDVSMHQGWRDAGGVYHSSINWPAARDTSGVRWAYFKLTEGIGYVDPCADSHLAGIRNAGGILPGAYHWGRPDTNTPRQDAEHFAANLLPRGLASKDALPPCLDMEQEAGRDFDYLTWTKNWVYETRRATGYPLVMIYASTHWWRTRLGNGDWLDENAFAWVADYESIPDPGDPGWKGARCVAHQYQSDGRIAGYDRFIDCNVCWVDLGSLATGGVPLPAPPGPTGPGAGAGDGMFRPGGWPLPGGHYFGDKKGPVQQHGGLDNANGAFPGEHEIVRRIQVRLKELGFDPGYIDGLWDPPTTAAMKRFQASRRLIQTGNCWPDDWDKLWA